MKESLNEKKTFSANLKNLYSLLTWIRERISKYFSQKEQENIELACEEVFVNIVKHGYKNSRGFVHMQIIINEHLEIIFIDDAKEFDFSSKNKHINKETTLDEKKVGGLGIYLIYKCVDEVKYERKSKQNILRLIKKRSFSY